MLTLRGGAVGALLITIVGMLAMGSPATAPVAHAQEAVADGITIVADLKLSREGVLEVKEQITVPEGDKFTMTVPLRVPAGEGAERVFEVTDITAEGAGTAKVEGDLFTVRADPGQSSFSYSVNNTVSEQEGTQLFHWVGVMNADIASITASLISPSFEMGIVDCKLGPPNASKPCADVHIEADGVLYLEQTDLNKGDAIDLTLQIPPGTVPANAEIRETGSTAFDITAPVLAAFGVLLVALAALAAYVFRARRQQAEAGTGTIDPVLREDGKAQFTSPDGILPGEAGVLLDESADATDIAATVVDLAVRRYLWIAPISDSDWRITRVNPADDQLRPYEKAVYEALLPGGAEAVTVSELRAPGRVQAGPVRDAMLADAVERGALIDQTRRKLPIWLGIGLLVVGVGATIGLALTSGHALVGVAIALAGVAALLLPRFLPTRTAHGRTLTGQVRALQRGLDALRRDSIPPADQELVFSRALPFTVITGRADNWIRTFRDLDPSADRHPGLYWFGGFDRDRNLHRFAGHFPYFITAVEGLFPAGN